MPEFPKLHSFKNYPNNLRNVFQTSTPFLHSDTCYDLLKSMLEYDPSRRITANDATSHPYFMEEPQPSWKYEKDFLFSFISLFVFFSFSLYFFLFYFLTPFMFGILIYYLISPFC